MLRVCLLASVSLLLTLRNVDQPDFLVIRVGDDQLCSWRARQEANGLGAIESRRGQRSIHVALRSASAGKGGDRGRIQVNFADAVVLRVRNVDDERIVGEIDCNGAWRVEWRLHQSPVLETRVTCTRNCRNRIFFFFEIINLTLRESKGRRERERGKEEAIEVNKLEFKSKNLILEFPESARIICVPWGFTRTSALEYQRLNWPMGVPE